MKKIYWLLVLVLMASSGLYLTFRKQNRTLLITGCARSGTAYIAKALHESGLEIGHEKMSKDGVSSWALASSPKKRKRRVNPEKVRFAHIFHQVRHPLDTISSVYMTEDRHSWNYIMTHTPEIHVQDSHLVKCAKYWYYWNLKAEQLAEWTYCVENLDTLWDEFGNRIGKKISNPTVAKVPKNTHTAGEHRRFSWEDLRSELEPELYRKILNLALKYGYSIPSTELSTQQNLN